MRTPGPSIRGFLRIREALTGRGVPIATVGRDFPAHPDIATASGPCSHRLRAANADAELVPGRVGLA